MPKPLNLSTRGTRLTQEKWEQIQILRKKRGQIQIKRTIVVKHCSSFGSRIYNETKWMTSAKHGINRNAIHGRLYLNFCTESTKILIRTAAAVWVYPRSGPCPKTVHLHGRCTVRFCTPERFVVDDQGHVLRISQEKIIKRKITRGPANKRQINRIIVSGLTLVMVSSTRRYGPNVIYELRQ